MRLQISGSASTLVNILPFQSRLPLVLIFFSWSASTCVTILPCESAGSLPKALRRFAPELNFIVYQLIWFTHRECWPTWMSISLSKKSGVGLFFVDHVDLTQFQSEQGNQIRQRICTNLTLDSTQFLSVSYNQLTQRASTNLTPIHKKLRALIKLARWCPINSRIEIDEMLKEGGYCWPLKYFC